MFERIITGGQTGADQGAWRAAKAAGLPTGGTLPAGFMTEAGPRPEFVELCGADECPNPDPATRTRINVRESVATIWFGDPATPVGRATLGACRALSRTFLIVAEGQTRPSQVEAWIREHRVRTLNVAGNPES